MITTIESGEIPPEDRLFDNRISCEWIATAAAAAYLKISPNALRIMALEGLPVPPPAST